MTLHTRVKVSGGLVVKTPLLVDRGLLSLDWEVIKTLCVDLSS